MNDQKFKRQLDSAFGEAPRAPGDEYQKILTGIRRTGFDQQKSWSPLSLAFCMVCLLIATGVVVLTSRDESARETASTSVSDDASLYDPEGDLGRDFDVSLEPLASVVEDSRKL